MLTFLISLHIRTVADVQKLMQMGVQGVCLGRVSVQNPLLFSEISKYLSMFYL